MMPVMSVRDRPKTNSEAVSFGCSGRHAECACCLGLLLAVVLAVLPSRCEAYSGEVLGLPAGPPTGPTKPKSGLQLAIDTRWVDANGYRPVRIEAVNWPPGPTTADRSFRVVIQPFAWQWGGSYNRVTGYVEIPEGAARGQTTLAVPQSNGWTGLEVRVYEDGRLLEDVSTTIGPIGLSQRAGRASSEALPAILIIDADAPTRDLREQQVAQRRLSPPASLSADSPRQLPDVSALETLLPDPNQDSYIPVPPAQPVPTAAMDDVGTLVLLQDLPRVELLPPSELPTRWIDFTCFDLAFISLADLRSLASKQPAAWGALREWAASGATLCVYEMELSKAELAELETLLGLVRGPGAASATDSAGVSHLWETPNPRLAVEEVTALEVVRAAYEARKEANGPADKPKAKPAPPPASRPFVHRAFRRGRVVAMQTDEPLAAGGCEAAWLLNELDGKSWMWYQRHGLSWHRENRDYWNWIVPGIGRAPVGTFLLLITAFCVVIGPVNYFFLRRRRHLYLLLVTVPVGAGLVTLALFTYALVSDGLGVRVRVRSFTEIDQRTEQAVSWSRQSYYAGLAPSGGLKFPERAAVFPFDQYPAERRDGRLGTQALVWDASQNLVSGYIGARSTAQFLVVESGPSRRALLVGPEQGSGQLQATNGLDAAIHKLIVKDDTGRVLRAEELAVGQSRRLEIIAPAVAAQELQVLLAANQPAYPPGYEPHYYGGLGFSNRYYRGWSPVDGRLPDPTFGTSVLERSLQATLRGDVRAWPPRSYVAITRTSPGVSLGYERAREEASFHVVYGTW